MSNNMMTPSPRPLEAYWLIVRSEAGRTQGLTVDPDGPGEALAVFGFEEEARISLGVLGAGWQLRETTAGELIQILLGPSCAGIGFVALDPLPEIVSRRMVGLVSLSRERFVDRLIAREKPLVSRARERTFIQEASGPEEKLTPLPVAHAGLCSKRAGT